MRKCFEILSACLLSAIATSGLATSVVDPDCRERWKSVRTAGGGMGGGESQHTVGRPHTSLGSFRPVQAIQSEWLGRVQKAYTAYEKRKGAYKKKESSDGKPTEGVEDKRYEKLEQEFFRKDLAREARESGENNVMFIVDSPASWSVKDASGNSIALPVHLAQVFTFDHHGDFLRAGEPANNEKRNSTNQALNYIKAVAKEPNAELRVKKLAELENAIVSTDNLGDGVLALWTLRNATRVANDPKLQGDIKAATFYEDYGLFGTKYDQLADARRASSSSPDLARLEGESDEAYTARKAVARAEELSRLERGREIAQAILQEYDDILRDTREKVLASNPPENHPSRAVGTSDRFNMLPEVEQRAITERALAAVDRALSSAPEDLVARHRKAAEFTAAIEKAKEQIPKQQQAARQLLINAVLQRSGGDTEKNREFANKVADLLGEKVFFSLSLDPTAPGVGRFSTWAALPRFHDKNTQVELTTLGAGDGEKTIFIQAHPHGRPVTERMAAVVKKIEKLHAQRSEERARIKKEQVMSAARLAGKSDAETNAEGEQAYRDAMRGVEWAVAGRPGKSDFNFSFAGVLLSPGDLLGAFADELSMQRSQRAQEPAGSPK